eukprot:TRINITY_DN834_c3_g1_i1.p1 TRINITY_DN834_c3_g1~~TRINITY_DN834_c3_g1_i1.p1  ORF type:complete len:731 (+),score=110.09 TRINITY_DN834_c3_g1_i1:70-2262(+)
MFKPFIRTTCLLAIILSVECFQTKDWLIEKVDDPATVVVDGSTIKIGNGIVTRAFVTTPAFGTVDLTLNATLEYEGEQSAFRAVTNESLITLNGTQYIIGGLRQASTFRAYCNRTELSLLPPSGDNFFKYVNHSVSAPVAPFPWTPGTRHSSKDVNWPPKGVVLSVAFLPSSANMPQVKVVLHYQVIQGIPLIQKWMTVELLSGTAVSVSAAIVDQLAVMPRFGAYVTHGSFSPTSGDDGAANTAVPLPLLYTKTDQAHLGRCRWLDDYSNSANPVPGCSSCKDEGAAEPLLSCDYSLGPGALITATNPFVSYQVLHLIADSTDLERHSLSRHRVTEALAPHVMENPVFFHGTSVSGSGFKNAIDQMAEVGFEMFIFSFGSGFNLESNDKNYINTIKEQISYANSKGIEVGGYDLICLDRGRSVPKQYQAGGNEGDACFASGWYDELHAKVLNFINETGLSMLETDGPYGGESCSSTTHEHHFGLDDSIYQQNMYQSNFYKEMRRLNIFINQPDNYFFQGGSKTGMGYDEQQYSLPRWRDLSISRMGMYDDLYLHLPTQGWMFLPIQDYHAGGSAASFAGHEKAYEWALAQYLGAGVAACYRGPQPYTSDSMKAILTKWISFYKAHRETLVKPVVHIRRPSLQSWDGWLHVNPFSSTAEVGLAMLFNPTPEPINSFASIDVYYTGATNNVKVTLNGDASTTKTYPVTRSRLILPIVLAPESVNYFTIEQA